ncbi:TetR/AcrR family transcriptional regulator [Thalassomonas viridans]|uniref:TetR/AcrR family transcriptional regulator n=1 Tax=Thalassomonas viridans TaxID=137584 RepID=A0AAE9ZC29_9GAMM|nr:TetR/AcrR family transcriptional regulator [Thalassomonas viridans]WDE08297.1 TetR/AcrR family transcriptional regulator [Thalassomonas viridans]
MRNAEFDREQVLRSAMHAFMNKGYGKTSMQDLTKATGLHPGSIYCAFDNKRGLLLAALTQYQQDRNTELTNFFTGTGAILPQLKNYLDSIVSECLSAGVPQACLMTRALSEIAAQDEEIQAEITASLSSWQQALTDKFAQAQANGELAATRDSVHLGRFFVMGIYGLRTFAQTSPEPEILQQLADQLFQDICA